MSKIPVGMYTAKHDFGMSTTPGSLPSIGAEPRIVGQDGAVGEPSGGLA